MKTPVPNPAYEKIAGILRAAGYLRRREAVAKVPKGCIACEDRLEFWVGPKGVIIVQVWPNGGGAATYANWTLGETFEELEKALK